ncbi:SCP-like protein [Teladorsagia circumcincta]|uniref:SCP-like protein n=1 Tax=Teladorsagia circumcincta TaxID=45464 RepID=A0A2G9U0T1_TELCI|nr:SCP-like protein [Teladorsagia circumcincta]
MLMLSPFLVLLEDHTWVCIAISHRGANQWANLRVYSTRVKELITGINQICSGNRGMNDRIRTIALQGHNYRRSRLALGRVRKNNGALLRPATNMIKLRYDCRLETSAKEVADKCTTSRSALPPEVKENIHRIHRSSARFRTDAMIEMAWATTKYIGCAVSQSCGSYWYIVCHYKIGGNVVNEHVYMPGRSCSQCPMGYYCDPSNGLCTKA